MRLRLIQVLIIASIMSCNTNSEKSEKMSSKIDFEQFEKIDKERDTIEIDELVKQFRDKNTPHRQNALYKINERNYSGLNKLLESSLYDEDEMIRILTIQIIKENNQFESIDMLIKLFNETDNYLILTNICKTFAEFKLREPIPHLIEKLISKNDMLVYDCVWTLGEIGGNSEIKILMTLTSNTTTPKVYDENGFLSKTSKFTIGEIAVKSIEKIIENEASH